MEKLEIEYLPIDDFKPYENNAKIHTPEQIEQIKKSIEEYGMCDPIGVWHDEIVEGHGRLMALKEMGEIIAPFVRLDHLSDEERKEYMLVHNQLTMNTGFDEEMLQAELEMLERDMSDFGFSIDDEVIEEEPEEKPEIQFTQVLNEENNYIVLKFTDEVDWLQVQTLFGLETVKAYSTRKDGVLTDSMVRRGVGRVVDGAEFLNKIGVKI